MLSALMIVKNAAIIAASISVFSRLLLDKKNRFDDSHINTNACTPNTFGCVVIPIQRGSPKSKVLMPICGKRSAVIMLAKVINKNNQNNHLIKDALLSANANAVNIEMNRVDDRNIKFLRVSVGLFAHAVVSRVYRIKVINSLFFKQAPSSC